MNYHINELKYSQHKLLKFYHNLLFKKIPPSAQSLYDYADILHKSLYHLQEEVKSLREEIDKLKSEKEPR